VRKQRASLALVPVSTIGAIALVVIAGELHRDLTMGTHHFHGPRWLKAVVLCGTLWLVAQESEKILRHIDGTLLKVEETNGAALVGRNSN